MIDKKEADPSQCDCVFVLGLYVCVWQKSAPSAILSHFLRQWCRCSCRKVHLPKNLHVFIFFLIFYIKNFHIWHILGYLSHKHTQHVSHFSFIVAMAHGVLIHCQLLHIHTHTRIVCHLWHKIISKSVIFMLCYVVFLFRKKNKRQILWNGIRRREVTCMFNVHYPYLMT